MGDTLPDFPVDESTLTQVEHALGAYLTFDRPEGNTDWDDDGPWVAGADFSIHKLLDFLSGTLDDDGELLPEDEWIGEIPTYVSHKPHYTERDIIRSLIKEVRRLREKEDEPQKWDYFYAPAREQCARMGCDKDAVLKIDELLLCGQHYKEHTG